MPTRPLCDAAAQATQETITVDARTPARPFPHFWEQMFGSGRAVLSMRESYREDLRQVKQITDFRYVRFHAILDDEVGVYGEDKQGNPIYNFENQRLRVGGPATAQAAWVDAIIAHTTKNQVPLDFVSTHAYGNDTAMDILGHPWTCGGHCPPPDGYCRGG